jgi:hypothetical protein
MYPFRIGRMEGMNVREAEWKEWVVLEHIDGKGYLVADTHSPHEDKGEEVIGELDFWPDEKLKEFFYIRLEKP